LLFFTEKGRCFWLKVYEIPETDKNAKGRAIQNLMQIPSDDKIRTVIDVPRLDDEEFVNSHSIVLCTQQGIIKKTKLKDFSRPRQSGVNAITINEGDRLLDVSLTDGDSYIMMAVKSGRAISFPEDKVRETGRGAIGVYGIELENDQDEVIGMVCVNKKDISKQILVVSQKGLGKRTQFLEELDDKATEEDKAKAITITDEEGVDRQYTLSYRITNRGGKGVKTINTTDKTGGLVGLLAVDKKDELMITCKSGITIRMKVEHIREAGRATQGVKLINLDGGDEIAAIARIQEQEEDEILTEDGEATEVTGEEGAVDNDDTTDTDAIDGAAETPEDEA
ncbi:MAG: DNA gyrase subunit A, partial [Sphingobacteriales bacterium]